MDNHSTDSSPNLLSILIPTYKRPELLALTLESVAAQTRPADEVIVVDNDKAKSASDTVKAFSHDIPNLQYIPASAKQGKCYALNIAGHAAKGNWLVFLDDDDYWDREYLETFDQAINKSGCNCIISWVAWDFDGIINGGKKMPSEITLEQIMWHGNPGFVGSNNAFEKSLFERLGGLDESMQSSEDIDLLIRIIESGAKYHVVEDFLSFQRQHSGPRLTDLSTGFRTAGAAKLLQKHGHKVSWKARRKMRGRLHASAYVTVQSPFSRWYHAVLATLNGNRSVTRDLLKHPW